MRKLTKLSILLTSASLCVALIGCQQGTDKKATDKSAEKKTEQSKNGGAKSDSALEKTKEKAKEVGGEVKEKTKEIASDVKEKTQEVTGSKNKGQESKK